MHSPKYSPLTTSMLALSVLSLLALAGCGIKGNLTPPAQITKEERSEPTQHQGRAAQGVK
ncbi:MAG: lipoprotein [Rickettsiales bacterium]|nr:lipoprotein [Rickettsiales bacterium]